MIAWEGGLCREPGGLLGTDCSAAFWESGLEQGAHVQTPSGPAAGWSCGLLGSAPPDFGQEEASGAPEEIPTALVSKRGSRAAFKTGSARSGNTSRRELCRLLLAPPVRRPERGFWSGGSPFAPGPGQAGHLRLLFVQEVEGAAAWSPSPSCDTVQPGLSRGAHSASCPEGSWGWQGAQVWPGLPGGGGGQWWEETAQCLGPWESAAGSGPLGEGTQRLHPALLV